MNEGQEKLQRKIGKRPGLFWLLFAVASCGWLIVSVTLHAEDNRTVADMNTCVDIAKSGVSERYRWSHCQDHTYY